MGVDSVGIVQRELVRGTKLGGRVANQHEPQQLNDGKPRKVRQLCGGKLENIFCQILALKRCWRRVARLGRSSGLWLLLLRGRIEVFDDGRGFATWRARLRAVRSGIGQRFVVVFLIWDDRVPSHERRGGGQGVLDGLGLWKRGGRHRVAFPDEHGHGGRVVVAIACFAAMYTDTFLCALAAGSVAHLHSGAASFREFARVGAGFPHGDSAAHRASYPAEMLAYVVSRAAPHALALAAAAPRAMAAATSAAPAVTSAVLTGVKAVMDAAAGSAGGAGAAGAAGLGAAAAAAGSAAEAVASAAAPAVPAVCACVVAAGSSLHSHSH